MKLDAKQLRVTPPTEEQQNNRTTHPIYLVLDNVLDTYNIGGIFRLAEAVGVRELVLCGESETPPSSRIHKAAVGTEQWVPWRYQATAAEAIRYLKKENKHLSVVAVEQSGKAVGLLDEKVRQVRFPVALVVGHETEGVSGEVMDSADLVVEIPMWGINKSLNVIVSTAIVLYKVMEGYMLRKNEF